MPNVAHADLTGANLHEPKGVAAAAANKVYVSNGAGSGSWDFVHPENSLHSTGENAGRILVTDGVNGIAFDTKVWKDLNSFPVARQSGATAPTFGAFIGGQNEQYSFAVNDKCGFQFHIPHDYALGTDLHFHIHWGHNGTAISGNMVWTYYATYAKGHAQAVFSPEVSGTITYSTVDIATTPRWVHRVDEVQISAATPSGSQIDSDLLEPDGLLMVTVVATTIPTITGGSPGEPFLFTADLHYQADYIGTKNKAPNFYV